MPKVSDYELDHSDEEVSFQKIRRKKSSGNQSSKKTKVKREKKIDFWDLKEETED